MLAILTPSRGRPDRLAEMIHATASTATSDWSLWLGLDEDDPHLDAYRALVADEARVVPCVAPRRNLVEWTNTLADLAIMAGAEYVASLGDDHHPRTPGWDTRLIGAIRAMGHGWAHGNDLLHPDLPTAWVQSASIHQALGWTMLPTCGHLMVDVVVRNLGHESGRLARLPSVVIEHMHPAAEKAELDASYRASNSSEQVERDTAAYRAWVRDQLARDAETIRALP